MLSFQNTLSVCVQHSQLVWAGVFKTLNMYESSTPSMLKLQDIKMVWVWKTSTQFKLLRHSTQEWNIFRLLKKKNESLNSQRTVWTQDKMNMLGWIIRTTSFSPTWWSITRPCNIVQLFYSYAKLRQEMLMIFYILITCLLKNVSI